MQKISNRVILWHNCLIVQKCLLCTLRPNFIFAKWVVLKRNKIDHFMKACDVRWDWKYEWNLVFLATSCHFPLKVSAPCQPCYSAAYLVSSSSESVSSFAYDCWDSIINHPVMASSLSLSLSLSDPTVNAMGEWSDLLRPAVWCQNITRGAANGTQGLVNMVNSVYQMASVAIWNWPKRHINRTYSASVTE